MKNLVRRFRRAESGQAIVEFALILPVLLLLLMGIIEFARAFNAKQVITDAAREGARLAVIANDDITQDTVRARIATALSRAGIPGTAVTISFNTANWRIAEQMQTVYVGVDYRFGFFGPVIKAWKGTDHMTIATVVTMRNEQ